MPKGHFFNKVVDVILKQYHNDPKFSDRQVWANSADPDQIAPTTV